MKRVLSLDGGGVHCILQATILLRIFEKYPTFFENIDIFSGTSAGALLCLALISRGPEKFVELINEKTLCDIFQTNYLCYPLASRGIFQAKYKNENLKNLLEEEFGEKKIFQMEKKIFIPTFKLCTKGKKHYRPKFFHNFDENAHQDVKIMDIGVRTTAAPTYFPTYQGYCDGGIVANNPDNDCISTVRKFDNHDEKYIVMSIGSGAFLEKFEEENDWGMVQWMQHILPILINSSSANSQYDCKNILGKTYFRLSPELEKKVELDDVYACDYLEKVGKNIDLGDLFDFIENIWNKNT